MTQTNFFITTVLNLKEKNSKTIPPNLPTKEFLRKSAAQSRKDRAFIGIYANFVVINREGFALQFKKVADLLANSDIYTEGCGYHRRSIRANFKQLKTILRNPIDLLIKNSSLKNNIFSRAIVDSCLRLLLISLSRG